MPVITNASGFFASHTRLSKVIRAGLSAALSVMMIGVTQPAGVQAATPHTVTPRLPLVLAPAAKAPTGPVKALFKPMSAPLAQPAIVCFAEYTGDTVTDFSSADASAVQQAVDAAPVNGVVKVAGTCAGVQLRGGTTQTVVITKVLTLAGGFTNTNWITAYPITQPTTLDAQTQGRVISATAAVTASNMIVQNGDSLGGSGGGAYFDSAATLSGTQFISNTATGANNSGGGAYFASTATLINARFITNTVTGSNSSGGGARAFTATLIGGAFINNSGGSTSIGGGLSAGTLVLTGTQFISNTANQGGGLRVTNAATLNGGLFQNNRTILSDGGGLWAGTLMLTDTQFINNTALGGGGARVFGSATLNGGLFISNTAGQSGGGLSVGSTLALTGTQFINNIAIGAGGLFHISGDGRIANALFARNRATNGRGMSASFSSVGIVNIIHTTVASASLSNGSAIIVNAGTVNITNTLIASHTIGIERAGGTVNEDYTLFSGVTTPYSGTVNSGANSITGTAGFANPAADDYKLTLASSAIDEGANAGITTDFFGNPRPQGNGFDIGFDEYLPVCFATHNNGTTVFSSTNFIAVQQAVDAASTNGTVKVAGTCAGVQTRAGTVQTVYISKTLTLAGGFTTTNWITPDAVSNATVLNAQTAGRVIYATQPVTISTLTLQRGNSSDDGGGAYFQAATVVTSATFISNTTTSFRSTGGGGGAFFNNTATITASSFISNAANSAGGGGARFNSTTLVIDTIFISNTAGNQGGGGAGFTASASVTNSTFISNNSGFWGGGAYFNNFASVTGTTFISNTAGGGGGAGFNTTAYVTGTTFSNNSTPSGAGGAIFNGATTVANSTFIRNTAASNNRGGGAWFLNTATVIGTSFISNTAGTLGGGGAYFSGATVMTGTHFISNTAGTGSGANFNVAAAVTDATFVSNTSSDNGGGAYFNGSATVTGTTFSSNIASIAGGGAYFNNSSAVIGTTFSSNTASTSGGGAHFYSAAAVTSTAFMNNSAGTNGGGVYFDTASSVAKSLVNVLFARNRAGTGTGIYVGSANPLNIIHSTIASPTLVSGSAIHIAAGTVNITNTLIANHAVGINRNNGTVRQNFNLFSDVATPYSGTVNSGGNSITGTAGFVDPSNDDYQLTSASWAVDSGINAGITKDFFDDPRPQGNGFDIGFNESPYTVTADLAISKTVTPDVVLPGARLTYTLFISNTGNAMATNATLTENLPAGVTFVGGSVITPGGSGVCSDTGCALGNLAQGTFVTATFVVSAPVTAGVITNTAGVTATSDSNTANNVAAVSTNVIPPPVCYATADDGTNVFSSANANAVQQAVDAASTNGTVKVAGTCAGVQTRAGTTQTVIITKTLTLAGGFTNTVGGWTTSYPITQPTTLDALTQGRVIFASAALTMSSLTVQNGSVTGNGGGAYFGGAATLTSVQFISNVASNVGGGALFLDVATLNGGLFQNNTSFSGGGLVAGSLTLTGTQFISNTATGAGGGAYVTAATMNGSLFQNNTGSSGGGVYAASTLALNDTQFISNTATANSGGGGGGAFVFSSATVNGGLFQNNRSNNGGGLIVNDTLALTGTQFISNTATVGGGLRVVNVATVNGGLFQNNQGTGSNGSVGGGLSAGSSLVLSGTQFISNTAPAANAGGGGATASGAVTLIGGSFISNFATGNGGGLFASSTLVMTGTQFISNTATLGGGLSFAGAATLNGGIFQNNTSTSASFGGGGLYANSTLVMTDTQFISNTASTRGGGLYQRGSADGRIVNALFAGNRAVGGSAANFSSSGTVNVIHATVASPTLASGSAVYVNNGTVTLTNTLIASHTVGIERAGGTANENYTLFSGVTTPYSGTVNSGGNSITGTAAFFNTTSYTLTAASSAVDAGTNADVTNDFFGNSRPRGNGFDIGYNESPFTKTLAACYATPDNGATVFSTTNADAVQQAVDAASANDTVKVAGTCASVQTRAGTTQTVIITKALTIVGGFTNTVGGWAVSYPITQPTTLDAQTLGRVIYTTQPATISNLIAQRGFVNTNGGGAYFGSTAALNSTTFISNTANNAGGAYFFSSSVLSGTQFISNTAVNGVAGAAWFLGATTLSDTQFINNTATNSGGAAIFNNTATLQDGAFIQNIAGASSRGGGALFYSAAILSGTQFISNTFISFGAGNVCGTSNACGGGAFFDAAASISGTTFTGNTARSGGGLFAYNTLALTNSTFISNTAQQSGGGAFTLVAVTLNGGLFQNNRSNNSGGGGLYAEGTIAVTSTQFINNTATNAGGGALFFGASTLNGGTFISNTATIYGGGAYINGTSTTLNDTQFISNTAFNRGGGVYANIAATMNGGSFISNTATFDGGGAYFNSTAVLASAQFISNTATNIGGGAAFNAGGGITNATFISNSASGNGGAVHNSTGTLQVSASQFISNSAVAGGGVFNTSSGRVTLDASTFTSNTTTGSSNGGGVYNSGDITITNGSLFRANTSGSGGALFNNVGTMRVLSSTVISNTASTGSGGGGFYNQTGGQIIIDNSDITANQAISGGAGIHMLGATSALTITASRLLSNTGSVDYGALYQQNGSSRITGSCIVGNSNTVVRYTGGTSPITATTNWWGSPSGPSGAGPGVGDSVSSNVDFSGFLTTTPAGCPALPNPDVAISKVVTPSSGLAGSAITYTLAFSNTGAGAAAGIIITDTLPAGVTINSVSSSGSAITQTSGAPNFAWQVSNLTAHTGGVITLTGTISTAAVAGIITNTAGITASGDGNVLNNVAWVTSTIGTSCIAPSTTYVDDNWVGTPNGSDPDGAGPATNFGCDAFVTVQGGINGVTLGGNVIVAAGTYFQPQVLITKSVTVTGAGPATTILNGQNIAPPSGGLVRIEPPLGDAGAVVFSGFTVISPGLNIGRYGMFVKPLDPAAVVTVTNNLIIGSNISFDNGLYIYRNRGAVVFTGNVITNTNGNGVIIEQPLGATEFSSNTLTVAGTSTSYFQMTYGGENVTTTQRVAYNTINSPLASGIIFNPSTVNVSAGSRYGKYTRVEIVGNIITNLGVSRNGIGLLNDSSDTSGAAGAIENVLVASNTITGTGALTSTGIQLRGLSTNALIQYNDIRNLARSIAGVIANTHAPTGTVVRYNNFVNNTRGLDWNANPTSTLNAENNWWGCNADPGNAGPGNTGCDPITGTQAGVVDFTPWIVLNVAASPSAIQPFGVATVTADLTQNSTPAPAGGTTPGMPVVFTATKGTIPSPGTMVAGTASALFTSNSANSAVVCAKVDNQTLCTSIVVTAAVGLSMQASAASALPGAALTYTLAFSNAGPGTANGVVITDTLPAIFTLDSVSSSGAVITQTSGSPNLQWIVSDLPAGGNGVITLAGTVSNSQALIGTSITNTAGITASNYGTPADNSAAAATVIIAPAVCYATPDNGATVFNSANAIAVQQAVDAASTGDTVKVAGTCAGVQTRAGTTQTVYISKTLTLVGGYTVTDWLASDSVANPTVLDAQNDGRVIFATQSMTASNLTVQHGHATGNGGGIYADSDMTLTGMRVVSNSVDNGEYSSGGGAYIKGAAIVSDATFISNSAPYGGGAYFFTSIVISSTFISNTAGKFGGGVQIAGAVTMSDTLFMSNTSGISGGGAHFMSSATLYRVDFTDNSADNTAGGASFLGAAVLTDTTFTRNTSLYTGGGWFWRAASVAGSAFISNSAQYNGGGAWFNEPATVTSTSFLNNSTQSAGGGLYAERALALMDVTFISNTASGTAFEQGGGGAYIKGAATVVNSSFERNTAALDGGGLMALSTVDITGTIFISNTATRDGGGMRGVGDANIAGSTFTANTALKAGGGVFDNALTMANTSVISNTAGAASSSGGFAVNGIAALTDVTFTLNSAGTGGAGGANFGNTAVLTGGAFISNTAAFAGGGAYFNGAAVVSGTRFAGNTATANRGGGAYFNSAATLSNTTFAGNVASADRGAGAYFRSNAEVSASSFINNSASNRAGGAYFNANATLTGTDFLSNTGTARAGGVYIAGTGSVLGGVIQGNVCTSSCAGGGLFISGTLTLSGTQFIGNTSGQDGGGAFTSSDATITVSTFMSNSSGSTAGGLFHSAGTLTLTGSTFIDNSTNGFGGGLNVANASTVNVTGSTFERNTAANGGGIIVAGDATLSVTASTFAGNQARNDIGYLGGGLYNFGRTDIANSTFAGNTANAGGGLGNGGTLTVTNSTIAANTAITGAGIANDPDLPASVTLLRNTLVASQTTGANCYSLAGTLTADAFNIADDATCNAATQKTTAQIALGPLANNGGGTKTMALGANSAALEAGDNAVCAAAPVNNLDQRGVTRPQVLRCDVGAFELQWTNNAPTADAGAPQSALVNTLVTLNGSGSSDPDGHALTYGWSQVSGTSVTLDNSTAVSPTFTTPNVTGELVFQLVVTDAFGAVSSPSFVTVTVGNGTPVANAGAPQSALVNMLVTLNGSGSSDPDGHTLTYGWSQVSGTTVVLSSDTVVSPTFTTPGTTGELVFQLIVTDAFGAVSTPSFVTITVGNGTPMANAGTPQSVVVNTLVTLDGSASSDPNGHALTYGWSQFSGPSVLLSSNNVVSPTFVAPFTTGVLVFQLIVTDAFGLASAPAYITVTVTNGEPSANAGAPQTVYVNSPVTLNGSASSDPENQPLTFGWSQVSGTVIALSSNSAVSPTFTAPAITDTLVFQLIVTDSAGFPSAPAFVTITVIAQPVTEIPPSGAVITATTGEAFLQPSVEFSSTLGDGSEPVTYTWDFGDGSPIYTGTTASHYYPPGTYTATLTATNSAGTVTTTFIVVVPWRMLLSIMVKESPLPLWLQQR